MENIETKAKKLKTIDKKRIYLSSKLNLLSYVDKIIVLNNLIDSSTQKYKKLLSIRKQYQNYFKSDKEFKYNKEINDLKESIALYEELKKRVKLEYHLKESICCPTLKVSEEQIKNIDFLTNNNTIVLFDKLKGETNTEKRLKILYELSKIYSKINIEYKKDIFGDEYKSLKKICKYISDSIKLEYIFKKKLKIEKNKQKNKFYYPVLKVNEEQIRMIDSMTNVNTLMLFNRLKNEINVDKKLEILYTLKEIYLKINQNYSKEIFGDKYKNIKEINLFINDAIRIEHKKRKTTNKKLKTTEEKYILNEKQEEILEKIKNNSNLDNYELIDILKSYKFFILHDIKDYPISTLKISKYISSRIIEEEIKDDDIVIMISSIKDAIKYRLLSLDKNDISNELERSLLKEIRIVFDFISKNYKEDLNSTNHDYKYDVIKYFLMEEEGYPYIKRIINDIPEMVNIRIKENNNEHIIINILKEYIYNLKKLLKNKKSDYINPDYLKQVYILFSHNVNLRLTNDDKEIIDNLLDDFLIYIDENVYKEERKTETKKEVKKLKTDYFYFEKQPKFKNIREKQLFWQMDYLKENKEDSINRHNRVEIKEETFTINNIQAYSLLEEDDKKILKIHVIDTCGVVAPRTTVDSLIYNYMMINEEIDYDIRKNMLLEVSKYNPTITYEFTIEKGNNISKFKIYKSKIKLNQKCYDDDLLYERNETLNKVALLTKKSLLIRNKEIEHIGLYTIDKTMEMLLNEEFIKYIENNKIPFIYSGKEYVNNYIEHMNNLNSIFNRLNESDFKKLYKIINDNVGEFNYSIYPFDVDGEYSLNLINDINYLFMFNQRLITDIIINKEEVYNKSKYIRECQELEHNLNLSINHIKPDDMKFKNKRKRNKLKEYNL